jgi:hypothetical protein
MLEYFLKKIWPKVMKITAKIIGGNPVIVKLLLILGVIMLSVPAHRSALKSFYLYVRQEERLGLLMSGVCLRACLRAGYSREKTRS